MSEPAPQPRPASWSSGGHEVDPPVTVRTFARQDERMPVLAFLESEGVPTHTPDGNVMSIDPGLFVALGFYKIQVPTSQVERARSLLAEWDDAEPLSENLDTGEWPPEEPRPDGGNGLPWVMAVLVLAGLLVVVLALRG